MTATTTTIRRVVNLTANIIPPTRATMSGRDARTAISTRIFQTLRSCHLPPIAGDSLNPVWNGSSTDTGLHRGPRAGDEVRGDRRQSENLESDEEPEASDVSRPAANGNDCKCGKDRDDTQIPER